MENSRAGLHSRASSGRARKTSRLFGAACFSSSPPPCPVGGKPPNPKRCPRHCNPSCFASRIVPAAGLLAHPPSGQSARSGGGVVGPTARSASSAPSKAGSDRKVASARSLSSFSGDYSAEQAEKARLKQAPGGGLAFSGCLRSRSVARAVRASACPAAARPALRAGFPPGPFSRRGGWWCVGFRPGCFFPWGFC